MAISSQNILPIHIAFIPLLVPPLLYVLTRLQIDRRLVACVITFGLVTHMFLPVGFGNIFLNEILLANVAKSGVDVTGVNVTEAMLIPALGMVAGLLLAVFVSYRRKRTYDLTLIARAEQVEAKYDRRSLAVAGVAIVVAFVVQLWLDSMIVGALVGFLVFSLSGVVRWNEVDDLFTQGMKMMAMIGFIMIAAAGFAEVMRATGQVTSLVEASAVLIGNSRALGALLMLLVGLLVTMGIGSSFSTVPIIAAIFVPLGMQLGFSPLAIVSIVGTAGPWGRRLAGLRLDPGPDRRPQCRRPARPYLGHGRAHFPALQPAATGIRLGGGHASLIAPATRPHLGAGWVLQLFTGLPISGRSRLVFPACLPSRNGNMRLTLKSRSCCWRSRR